MKSHRVRFESFTGNPGSPGTPLVDLRIGATIKSAGPALLRAIAEALRGSSDRGIRVRRMGGPSTNPTLVHHGKATAARWHIVTAGAHEAVADLYAIADARSASAIGQCIADEIGKPLTVLSNHGLPKTLAEHGTLRDRSGSATFRPSRANPGTPIKGELWGSIGGGTSRVLEVAGPRVHVVNMQSGNREWLMLTEFRATHHAPRRRNPARGAGAKRGRKAKRKAYRSRRVMRAADARARAIRAGGDGKSELARYTARETSSRVRLRRRTANPGRRIGGKLGLRPEDFQAVADSVLDTLAHHGKNRPIRDAAKRELRRRGVRWSGEGVAERVMGWPKPNPRGRSWIAEMADYHRGMGREAFVEKMLSDMPVVGRLRTELRVAAGKAWDREHIAQGRKMAAERRAALEALDAEFPKPNPKRRNARGGPRIVYNRLLGGWYVVTGPHQTPLNGRFNSKAEAQAWLSGGPRRNPKRGGPTTRLAWQATHTKGVLRAETAIGDYYIAKTLNEAGRVVGYSMTLNTYATDARGSYWQLLPPADSLAAAKRAALEDAAARGLTPNPLSRSRFVAAINSELKALGHKRIREDERRWARSVTGSGDAAQVSDLAYRIAKQREAAGELPTPNPRRRNNPRPFADERARAEAMFEKWHEFPAEKVNRVKVPSRTIPKHVVGLGKVVRIDYISNKWEGKPVTYTHSTKRPYPELVTDPDGRQMYLVGGKMKPTADGLVN